MRKQTVWVAAVVTSLILIMATPQRGQTAPGQSSDDNARARRSIHCALSTQLSMNIGPCTAPLPVGMYLSPARSSAVDLCTLLL